MVKKNAPARVDLVLWSGLAILGAATFFMLQSRFGPPAAGPVVPKPPVVPDVGEAMFEAMAGYNDFYGRPYRDSALPWEPTGFGLNMVTVA